MTENKNGFRSGDSRLRSFVSRNLLKSSRQRNGAHSLRSKTNMRFDFLKLRTAFALLALFLGGCAVGPDFRSPAAPTLASLTPEPLKMRRMSGPEQQAYVKDLEIPQRWWELFNCRGLNAITARAIQGNADLEAAQAAVRVASANTEAARGAFFPQIGASAGASSQKPPATGGASASAYSVSSGQLSVSFIPDVFGLTRRQVESLAAQTEVQRFEVEATYLTLTSKLAIAAVQEASLRDQAKAMTGSIAIAGEVLSLLKRQLDAHEASRVDIAAQEATLAQFEQQLHALTKQLGANRDLMIALTGRLAGEGLKENFDFACFRLPPDLPLSLPSTIVKNRPDIQAAEASMHAATASVGVAIANRLPQFNLTASAGTSATAISKLASFSSPLFFWSLAGNTAVTLFDGMTLQQKQRAAEAGLDQAAALYRSAVIAAFQNIADVLQTLETDRRLYRAAERGERAARLNLTLTRRLMSEGQANMLQMLNAQQMYAQAAANKAQARAARFADTILLFQALGGGWRSRDREQKIALATRRA
jgi:NodT family efflux transporter outer membrane factor (OMF) lipoprotein